MFLPQDYLLATPAAKRLYLAVKDLPIYDYHCHINPSAIETNQRFENITQVWLGGDHYKWRLMRANGVSEDNITGEASDRDKFEAWCGALPYAMGNPLYHWSHLELRKYFRTDLLIKPQTAQTLWEQTQVICNSEAFNARHIIKASNVALICTTDDPIDTLDAHEAIKKDTTFSTDVIPAFRPDKSYNIHRETFLPWFDELQGLTPFSILSMADYLKALTLRLDYFEERGCKLSDHALDPIPFHVLDDEALESIFTKALKGQVVEELELNGFITKMLCFYGAQYHQRNWVMQLHIGTMRNVNARMHGLLGPDTGFDAMGDWQFAKPLSQLLSALDMEDSLPKTILYSLNPKDNASLMTIAQSFQSSEAIGKIQLGSAWWFNDHIDGMEKQLKEYAANGLLGRFIGMTTDSRSFLSYTRHDYFRRIVANVIGGWVDKGELPEDWVMLEEMMEGIAYYNAVRYFNMGNVQQQLSWAKKNK